MTNETGLFSSNRAGGKGSDDEYMYKKKNPKLVTFYADGTVYERNDKANTTLPVGGANVTITTANGQRQTATSGPDGKFSVKLDSVTNYTFVAERPGDFTARTSLNTSGRKPSQDQLPLPMNDLKLPVNLTLNKIILAKAIEVNFCDSDFHMSEKFTARGRRARRT